LDGWAYLYEILEDGRRQILDFSLPGALIGFQPHAASELTYSAQALTSISVCSFSRKRFNDFARTYPEMALRLASIAARDQYLAFHHLSNIGRRTARERVANLLLELFYRARVQSDVAPGDSIDMPLTQEQIGDAVGLTNIHVNRMLRDLRLAGLLEIIPAVPPNRGGTLRILDPDRLAEEAGFVEDVVLDEN